PLGAWATSPVCARSARVARAPRAARPAQATLLAGKLLEGEVDELPDLEEAEALMSKYKLDEDARSKLREIIEKRASDKSEVLAQIKKHLDTSSYPSSMLCKIARPLIDGEKLQDPPERPNRPPPRENPAARDSARDDRGGEREQRRRSRSRDNRDRGERERRSPRRRDEDKDKDKDRRDKDRRRSRSRSRR
ncbi:unnamed protein product, partial [Prorocentrum cordatum]